MLVMLTVKDKEERYDCRGVIWGAGGQQPPKESEFFSSMFCKYCSINIMLSVLIIIMPLLSISCTQ